MTKRTKQPINDVYDYNEAVQEILDCWLEGFLDRDDLTREPEQSDFDAFGEGVQLGYMYTTKAMRLYERACKRFYELGKLKFPNDIKELDIQSDFVIEP